jgi:hypothetical protein
LLCFTMSGAYAQCKDSALVKPWGKLYELQYNSNIYRLEHRSSDSLLPANIRDAVKEALVKRCGESFYKKLRIKDLSIVIPLKPTKDKDDLRSEAVTKKGDIKYYYSYEFFEAPNIIYLFNIAMDVQGKFLSDWTLPIIKEGEYSELISFCEAAEIAHNDKKLMIKKMNEIALMYETQLNHFAWKVTVGFATDEGHFKTYRITINAFTGKIIDRWEVELKQYDNPGNK